MYKSNKDYKSIHLFKEDLLQLDNLLKQKFGTIIDRKSINLNTPNRTISNESMEQLLNDASLKIETISINLYKFGKGHKSEQYIRVYIHKYSISVEIEGENEIWVNGMELFLSNFFKERKSRILKLAKFIPILLGGFIGLNTSLLINAAVNNNLFSIIISGILLILGFIFSYPKLTKKISPNVKVSLKEKKKIDRNELYTLIGIIISFIALIVSIIPLWK
ncbi:DUF3784 domain-containing protein [Bacillus gobiensis]|uniref:hypothetical protein n=1 Tax=Bacillus gobiensis TaxID=1441095 RepID=UPI003D1C2F6D